MANSSLKHLPWFVLAVALSGCTSVHDYFANGFKVGPNYAEPPTPVAKDWIKAKDWVGCANEDDGLKNDKDVKLRWADTGYALVKRKSDDVDDRNGGPSSRIRC